MATQAEKIIAQQSQAKSNLITEARQYAGAAKSQADSGVILVMDSAQLATLGLKFEQSDFEGENAGLQPMDMFMFTQLLRGMNTWMTTPYEVKLPDGSVKTILPGAALRGFNRGLSMFDVPKEE